MARQLRGGQGGERDSAGRCRRHHPTIDMGEPERQERRQRGGKQRERLLEIGLSLAYALARKDACRIAESASVARRGKIIVTEDDLEKFLDSVRVEVEQ